MNRTLLTIVGSALVGAVIGALVLHAYGPAPLPPPPPPSLTTATIINCGTPGIHCIKVFFYGAKKKLQVNNTHLYKTGTNQTIYWFLDNSTNPSFTFPSDGIAFTSSEGMQEFTNCAVDSTGLIFSCFDATGTALDEQEGYPYKVTVTNSAGASRMVLDPHVINY